MLNADEKKKEELFFNRIDLESAVFWLKGKKFGLFSGNRHRRNTRLESPGKISNKEELKFENSSKAWRGLSHVEVNR